MRGTLQGTAFLAAILGLALPVAAQTSGGTGTASSSPGVSSRNESETGVGVPGTAPVDNRTHDPVQPGTGEARSSSSATGPSATGTGVGQPSSADEWAGSTGSSNASAQESMEGHLGHKAPGRRLGRGLAELHAANRAEITSGELAERSASSPDVKAFAQRMVEDHTKADQELVSMAQPRVHLTGRAFQAKQEEAAASLRDLQGKTGSDFDQAYIQAMVKDHQEDSAEVQSLADQARKDGAKDWADYLDRTGQTIQAHLSDAQRIQSSIQNTASTDSNTSSTGSSGDTGSNGNSN